VVFQNNPPSQANFYETGMNDNNGISVIELIFLVSEIFIYFQNNNFTETFNAVVKFIKKLSYILHPSHPPHSSFYEGETLSLPPKESFSITTVLTIPGM